MHPSTRVIRAGLPPVEQGAPFLPGPTFAAPYHLAGDPTTSSYTYGRFHNPTWTHFEAALAELEGGPALVFGSGMAAIASIFGAVLRPGDIAVLPADSYYTTRLIATGYFTQMGVQVRLAPTAGNAQIEHIKGAKLVWLETPTNPGLEVCEIATLVEAAHTQIGAIPGPMEVWLAHRSLATLALRLERACANALALAAFLQRHPAVLSVRYPGLPDDPSHLIAARQMRHYGPVVSFTLADRAAAERFLASCQLISEATSFGGLHTMAERRARWGGDAVSEGFIRLSAGIEHIDDLLTDLEQGLNTLSAY